MCRLCVRLLSIVRTIQTKREPHPIADPTEGLQQEGGGAAFPRLSPSEVDGRNLSRICAGSDEHIGAWPRLDLRIDHHKQTHRPPAKYTLSYRRDTRRWRACT